MAPSGQASRDLLIDNNATYDLTHTAGKPEQAPGTYVCMSGANIYESNGGHLSCGHVVDDEVTITYRPLNGKVFTLTDATTASIVALVGDSGAPVNAGNALIGTHSAYNVGLTESAFTKAYNVAARTGVTFLY